MSENIDDQEDEKKIKVVKLRKKVVKVVTRLDRGVGSNETKGGSLSTVGSHRKQETGRNYTHNRESSGGHSYG
ncbi:hypothetical protein, partial [Borrelia sp. P9F1]|uniref:hypothetical protein n=1 Tax=Borrelia sp. P9F1 TaxID=3058374 RepID=UPI002647DD8B